MIVALVAEGCRVGIAAQSHKAITNLLREVCEAADEAGVPVRAIQKCDRVEDTAGGVDVVTVTTTNKAVDDGLAARAFDVVAGTAWLFSRAAMDGTLDVLVVDEAGQMSLANALDAGQAAKSIVLLGDPQQLEQPIQGTHPPGCAASALEHLLQGEETIPPARGLFLPETWRLHPSICAFTSELFYDARLNAQPGRERQCLVGTGSISGAGLWFAPVEHEGNQTSSPEEVERVADLMAELLCDGAYWIDAKGEQKPLTLDDILIVAPYNAQVAALRTRLPTARIGTVDKFQGQEAPVVIYSMATSSADEAPRGMEFVFSPNRLNVATSRARCACVIVASPKLFETECRTVRQMRLVNALCRYRELAESVSV
jgi:uncharacterized protein